MACGPGERNPVSVLYEHSGKHGYPKPEFIDGAALGGYREFVCTVKLETPDLKIITATGKTKVLAKREACGKAVAELFPGAVFTKAGNVILPNNATVSSALPAAQAADPRPADTYVSTGEKSDSANDDAQIRPLAESSLKRKISETDGADTSPLKLPERHRDNDGFPQTDELNLQSALICVIRDMRWPERTFGNPKKVDDKIQIAVRVGPQENTSKYAARGEGATLVEAMDKACDALFKRLEQEKKFKRLWYERTAADMPFPKMTVTFTADGEIPMLEHNLTDLNVSWVDPYKKHGFPRHLHFDAVGDTYEQSTNKCAEDFFLFLGIDSIDYRIAVQK